MAEYAKLLKQAENLYLDDAIKLVEEHGFTLLAHVAEQKGSLFVGGKSSRLVGTIYNWVDESKPVEKRISEEFYIKLPFGKRSLCLFRNDWAQRFIEEDFYQIKSVADKFGVDKIYIYNNSFELPKDQYGFGVLDLERLVDPFQIGMSQLPGGQGYISGAELKRHQEVRKNHFTKLDSVRGTRLHQALTETIAFPYGDSNKIYLYRICRGGPEILQSDLEAVKRNTPDADEVIVVSKPKREPTQATPKIEKKEVKAEITEEATTTDNEVSEPVDTEPEVYEKVTFHKRYHTDSKAFEEFGDPGTLEVKLIRYRSSNLPNLSVDDCAEGLSFYTKDNKADEKSEVGNQADEKSVHKTPVVNDESYEKPADEPESGHKRSAIKSDLIKGGKAYAVRHKKRSIPGYYEDSEGLETAVGRTDEDPIMAGPHKESPQTDEESLEKRAKEPKGRLYANEGEEVELEFMTLIRESEVISYTMYKDIPKAGAMLEIRQRFCLGKKHPDYIQLKYDKKGYAYVSNDDLAKVLEKYPDPAFPQLETVHIQPDPKPPEPAIEPPEEQSEAEMAIEEPVQETEESNIERWRREIASIGTSNGRLIDIMSHRMSTFGKQDLDDVKEHLRVFHESQSGKSK